MVWLAGGVKILKIPLFVLTKCTNVTDGHTLGRTPHDGIGRTCIASVRDRQTDRQTGV